MNIEAVAPDKTPSPEPGKTPSPSFSWRVAGKHVGIPSLFFLIVGLVFVMVDPSINSGRLGYSMGRFLAWVILPVGLLFSYLLQTGRRTAAIITVALATLLTVAILIAVTDRFSANKNPLTDQERGGLVAEGELLGHPHLGFSVLNPTQHGYSSNLLMGEMFEKRFGGRKDVVVYAWSKGNPDRPDDSVVIGLHAVGPDDNSAVVQFMEGLRGEMKHNSNVVIHEDTLSPQNHGARAQIRMTIEGLNEVHVRAGDFTHLPSKRRFLLFMVAMGKDSALHKRLMDSLTWP